MHRHGTTSVELLVVLALAAILATLGVPSLRYAMDRRAVEGATQLLVEAHREARSFAVTSQRVALLTLGPDSLILRAARDGDTVVVWRRAGPRAFGVAVSGPVHLFRFIPYGYTIGASNASYVVSRGAATRRVVIARYGLVRVR
ncbi:MAG TPA: hypothetical protein VFI13_00965 [Gemmatimonadales bacterium]|nr:hypothetical protein [Gemmatimonadales bacterium]